MRLYIEIDVDNDPKDVADALDELSTAIMVHVANGTGEAFERRTMDEYRSISPDVLTDIDVR